MRAKVEEDRDKTKRILEESRRGNIAKSMGKKFMNASRFCNHANLRLHSPGGEAFLDSNIKLVRVQFICMGCGQPFRALGVRDGISVDAPTSDDDGQTTTMPIVPVGENPDMTTREMFS